MTATNMVRIPTIPKEEVERHIKERKCIPTRWSESLYLEWYGTNGRVLIEGSGFACTLSAARWKLTEEAHRWICRLKERHEGSFVYDNAENCFEDPEESDDPNAMMTGWSGLGVATVNGEKPHPLVRHTSEFLMRMILECKSRRFYIEDAIENYPLEGMIEATNKASIRLARAMAKASASMMDSDLRDFVLGLKQARWAFGEATENAGLAKHMGSAEQAWLDGLRREFREIRKEIASLIHEHEEQNGKSPAIGEATSAETPDKAKPETPS